MLASLLAIAISLLYPTEGRNLATASATSSAPTYHFEDLSPSDQAFVRERYQVLMEAQRKHDYQTMLGAAVAINRLVDDYKDSAAYHNMAISQLEATGIKVEPLQRPLPERAKPRLAQSGQAAPKPRTFENLTPARKKFVEERYALLLKDSEVNNYQSMADHARDILGYVDDYERTKALERQAKDGIDAKERANAAARKK
jgi:hypothetical protein